MGAANNMASNMAGNAVVAVGVLGIVTTVYFVAMELVAVIQSDKLSAYDADLSSTSWHLIEMHR